MEERRGGHFCNQKSGTQMLSRCPYDGEKGNERQKERLEQVEVPTRALENTLFFI